MFQRAETPPTSLISLGANLDSLFCHPACISLLVLVGVRVGRSEASCHGHGSEAYRDRAGAREHHYVSFASRYRAMSIGYIYELSYSALQNVTGLDVRVRKLEPHIEKNLIDGAS